MDMYPLFAPERQAMSRFVANFSWCRGSELTIESEPLFLSVGTQQK